MGFTSRAVVAVVVIVGSAMFGIGEASAAVYQFPVYLDGLQETPPVVTAATGYADVTFNDITGAMTVANGTFQNMTGTSINAHVHGYQPAGVSAGVVFGLTFSPGVNSGTFSGSGTIPGTRIADVLAGLTYINIHSSAYGGGEIRGQIIVPEPASGALALLAAGAALLGRRRR